MPNGVVTSPDGRKVKISWEEGGQPPNPAQLDSIFARLPKAQAQPAQTQSGPSAQQIFNQPVNTAMSGLREIGQGNFGVGGTKLARAGAQFIPAIYGGATQGLRELGQASGVPIVNELAGGAANALELPGQVIGGVTNLLSKGASAIGDPLDKAMGLEKAGQSPYAKELGGLAQDLAPYAVGAGLTKGATKGVSSAAKSITERPTRLATKEIKRVAPPKAQELHYNESLKRSLPYIAEEVKKTPIDLKQPESAFQQASDVVKNAKTKLWEERISPQIARHKDVPVSGDVISNAVEKKINFYLEEAEPTKAQSIKDYADKFRGKTYTISQVNELITGLNAEIGKLNQKTPEGKAAVMQIDPLSTAREGAVEAMRDVMIRTLSERGEVGVKSFRQDYGALRQIQDAIRRNVNRAEKADIHSFSDVLRRHGGTMSMGLLGELVGSAAGLPPGASTGLGVGAMTVVEMAKRRARPNQTINRAFNRLGKP